MTAGLPKSKRLLGLSLLFLVGFGICALTQTVEIPSVVIDPLLDVQTSSTSLEPIFDALALSPIATEEQMEALGSTLIAAVEGGVLSTTQALDLLALSGWQTITSTTRLDRVIGTFLSVLDGLTDGTLAEDPLVALADALGDELTPAGILNAIERAGASEPLLDQVQDLVVAGVPPGILVRVTRSALRDGLGEAEIAELLDALALGADGDSWGQLANEVTDQGAYKHQDREQNQNQNAGPTDGPELEEEQNQHGRRDGEANSTNAGQKKSPPGQSKKG